MIYFDPEKNTRLSESEYLQITDLSIRARIVELDTRIPVEKQYTVTVPIEAWCTSKPICAENMQFLTRTLSDGTTYTPPPIATMIDTVVSVPYDPMLYTLVDRGNVKNDPVKDARIVFTAGNPPQIQSSVTPEWCIDWQLIARDIDTIRPKLIERLGIKKKQVEDSGIVLQPAGITIATAESDRLRILSLAKSYKDNPDNPLFDTLKFKNADNVFVPLDKSLIIPLFELMTDRTLDVFAREAAIQEVLFSSNDPEMILPMFFVELDKDWPPMEYTTSV